MLITALGLRNRTGLLGQLVAVWPFSFWGISRGAQLLLLSALAACWVSAPRRSSCAATHESGHLGWVAASRQKQFAAEPTHYIPGKVQREA